MTVLVGPAIVTMPLWTAVSLATSLAIDPSAASNGLPLRAIQPARHTSVLPVTRPSLIQLRIVSPAASRCQTLSAMRAPSPPPAGPPKPAMGNGCELKVKTSLN